MKLITIAALAIALVTAAFAASAVRKPKPTTLTATQIDIVDANGRVIATLGTSIDGESPTLLMYDRQGRVRAALVVDSVTGEQITMGTRLNESRK